MHAMLAEAWLDEYAYCKSFSTQAISHGKSEDSLDKPLPSLVELSFKHAIIGALDSSQMDQLNHLLWVPENMQVIKKIFRDDSLYIDFTTTHQYTYSPFNSDIASQSPNVTAEILIHLLTHLPNLHHLFLLDTGITKESLLKLFKTQPSIFYNLSTLIHPALLNENDEELAWTADYAHIAKNFNAIVRTSLPIFTPIQVVQSVISIMQLMGEAKSKVTMSSNLRSTEILFQAVLCQYVPRTSARPAILRMHEWMFLLRPADFGNAINKFAWVRFNAKEIEGCGELNEDGEKRIKGAIDALGEKLFEVYGLHGFLDASSPTRI
ncbi:hypothetical protein M422DRAFT_238941 [Sphaerobolus stellatus SS14]|nr:hypothetical protein M422DRAFT_238941 [Sphaerobolus stellatus SS14]